METRLSTLRPTITANTTYGRPSSEPLPGGLPAISFASAGCHPECPGSRKNMTKRLSSRDKRHCPLPATGVGLSQTESRAGDNERTTIPAANRNSSASLSAPRWTARQISKRTSCQPTRCGRPGAASDRFDERSAGGQRSAALEVERHVARLGHVVRPGYGG